MYKISLKLVLRCCDAGKEPPNQENEESLHALNESSEDKCNLVPIVLRRLHEMITNTKYEELRKDPTWGHQDIKVCEDCYLYYTGCFMEKPVKAQPKANVNKTENTWDMISEISPVNNKRDNFKLKEELLDFRNIPNHTQVIKLKTLPPVKHLKSRTKSAAEFVKIPRPKSKNQDKRLPQFSAESCKRAMIIYGKKSATNFSTDASSKYSRSDSVDRLSDVSKEKQGEFLRDTISRLKLGLYDVNRIVYN